MPRGRKSRIVDCGLIVLGFLVVFSSLSLTQVNQVDLGYCSVLPTVWPSLCGFLNQAGVGWCAPNDITQAGCEHLIGPMDATVKNPMSVTGALVTLLGIMLVLESRAHTPQSSKNPTSQFCLAAILGITITLLTWFAAYEPSVVNSTPFSQVRVLRGFPVPWLVELLSPGPALGLVLHQQTSLLGLLVDFLVWFLAPFIVLLARSRVRQAQISGISRSRAIRVQLGCKECVQSDEKR